MTLKLGRQHRVLEYYQFYSNDNPGLTLTYFTARSNLVLYAFVWEKGKTMDFSETIVVYDLKLATDGWSDKKFLLTSKLCPLGAFCPCPGAIYMYKIMKKIWKKSDFKEVFLKLATNNRSDKRFVLTSKFCPFRLSAPAQGLCFNFFSTITADFNISSALRWAIQEKWSSGWNDDPRLIWTIFMTGSDLFLMLLYGWQLIEHWVLLYFQVCFNSAYPQHLGGRYRTNGPLVCSNRIRTPVAMATYSCNWLIMGKVEIGILLLSHCRYFDKSFTEMFLE